MLPQLTSACFRLRRDVPAPGLTEHEKYLFDLHGYLVVKAALTPEQLEAWRAGCARVLAQILSAEGIRREDGSESKYMTESGRLPHRYSFGSAPALSRGPSWWRPAAARESAPLDYTRATDVGQRRGTM